ANLQISLRRCQHTDSNRYSDAPMNLPPRRLAIAAVVLLALIAAVTAGLALASRQLQAHIEQALGPRASIGELHAGWTGVEVIDLRIQAAPGWPATDELRAHRVHVIPDLRGLFGGPWRIAQVTVEGGYLSVLRS